MMSDAVIVALLSCGGTLIGSVVGILAANKLTNYRIEQLEKKVEKHNTVVERIAVVERDLKTAFNKVDDSNKRIGNIEAHLIDDRK